MSALDVSLHGDVVVIPEVRQSHLVYVMHINGGGDQIAYPTREAAVANAIAYARRTGVDAWYGERSEFGLVPLGSFRSSHDRRSAPCDDDGE